MSATHPIIGRVVEGEEISYEQGIKLLEDELSFTEEDVLKEVKNQWGVYVGYTHLKKCYERLLNKCNWRILLMMMRRRSRVLLGPHALRRFCCSWLATPFLPTRNVEALV